MFQSDFPQITLRLILFSMVSVFSGYFFLTYGKWSCKAREDRKKVYIAQKKKNLEFIMSYIIFFVIV